MKELKLFGSVTVGTKGQIVIPAEAREELQIKEGDKLIVMSGRHGGLAILKRAAVENMLKHAQTNLGKIADSIQE